MNVKLGQPRVGTGVRCRRCGRRLGWFQLNSAVEIGDEALKTFDGSIRGPRTGTGLYIEKYGGNEYVRLICKCGRNEKVAIRGIPQSDEPTRYL